ncbi:hypothetical protein [Aerococcus sp. 1KP-2016]|uniref:hypothetical protein n=1 Tax=Aerococcus sp. 1KP-2016 TaxID=1981982 RepID=UPI000B99BE37|nr:hypothetical protein [Aerococcus sp. 1KP-2016]OYQ68287.1 hypothetical protein B9P78_00315 [Aerococcus sp. 1KP-2016]
MNLQEELKALKQRIAELEELSKKEQEFPQKYDDCWYIDDDAEVLSMKWYNSEYDQGRLSIGNVFRTEEQAEFAVEKLKVEAELRKYSRPFENGKFNYYIFFYTDNNYIEVVYKNVCRSQGGIYFESEEKAQQAISTVGEERIKKYIFGVED